MLKTAFHSSFKQVKRLIVNLRVPNFIVRVLQTGGSRSVPAVVRDEGRIISANTAARELGVKAGALLSEIDIPDAVDMIRFDLESLVETNQQLRQEIQRLSPLIENLQLGDFFVEIESPERLEDWFDGEILSGLPLIGGAAPNGWLAYIVSHRLKPGDIKIISENDFEETIHSVSREEMWGLGSKFIDILEEHGIKNMGELYYLQETERRKLLGSRSRLLHKLFSRMDPRPMSVFSRPRSLSREISIPPDDARDQEAICRRLAPVMSQFSERLKDSASLAYRFYMGLRFSGDKQLVRSHEFTTPTDEPELFEFALGQALADVALTSPVLSIAVELDVIVADIENYHKNLQEVPGEIEILEN